MPILSILLTKKASIQLHNFIYRGEWIISFAFRSSLKNSNRGAGKKYFFIGISLRNFNPKWKKRASFHFHWRSRNNFAAMDCSNAQKIMSSKPKANGSKNFHAVHLQAAILQKQQKAFRFPKKWHSCSRNSFGSCAKGRKYTFWYSGQPYFRKKPDLEQALQFYSTWNLRSLA